MFISVSFWNLTNWEKKNKKNLNLQENADMGFWNRGIQHRKEVKEIARLVMKEALVGSNKSKEQQPYCLEKSDKQEECVWGKGFSESVDLPALSFSHM